ncbi:MAG: hypothetical protein IT573_11500, partial [Deltaproteobacteria bacterium]|nr:hypothetical protein [Deltaproteobacteria bacterium]
RAQPYPQRRSAEKLLDASHSYSSLSDSPNVYSEGNFLCSSAEIKIGVTLHGTQKDTTTSLFEVERRNLSSIAHISKSHANGKNGRPPSAFHIFLGNIGIGWRPSIRIRSSRLPFIDLIEIDIKNFSKPSSDTAAHSCFMRFIAPTRVGT